VTQSELNVLIEIASGKVQLEQANHTDSQRVADACFDNPVLLAQLQTMKQRAVQSMFAGVLLEWMGSVWLSGIDLGLQIAKHSHEVDELERLYGMEPKPKRQRRKQS